MFSYQKICQDILKNLSPRTGEVLSRRFGLKTGERETLEAIGQDFGICRERVRQIEGDGFSKIKPKIEKYQKIFQYFTKQLKNYGDFKKEDILLSELGGEKWKSQVYFLLTLDSRLERFGESEDFHSLWTINRNSLKKAQELIDSISRKLEKVGKPTALKEICSFISLKNPVLTSYTEPPKEARWEKKAPPSSLPSLSAEARWEKRFISSTSRAIAKGEEERFISSTLEISKKIQKNSEDLFGLRDWPEINPRGARDKAYLVFKKAKIPLHFTKVAEFIEGALPQTVHNELIRDERFVLVGRGIYALREWGYEPGQVKDVILKILKDERKPLAKEEILEKTLKQRLVKENTIFLNLSNTKYFLRDSQGKYIVKED